MPVRKPAPKAPWYIAGLVVLLAAGGYIAWSTSKKAEADQKAAAARIVPVEPVAAPDTAPVNPTTDTTGINTAVTPVQTPIVPAPRTVPAELPPAPQPTPPRRAGADSAQWQRAVVTIAVNVREKPDRASRALLVLVPDDVVLLGESITGWRRVRVDGIDGWVDPRHFEIRAKKK